MAHDTHPPHGGNSTHLLVTHRADDPLRARQPTAGVGQEPCRGANNGRSLNVSRLPEGEHRHHARRDQRDGRGSCDPSAARETALGGLRVGTGQGAFRGRSFGVRILEHAMHRGRVLAPEVTRAWEIGRILDRDSVRSGAEGNELLARPDPVARELHDVADLPVHSRAIRAVLPIQIHDASLPAIQGDVLRGQYHINLIWSNWPQLEIASG